MCIFSGEFEGVIDLEQSIRGSGPDWFDSLRLGIRHTSLFAVYIGVVFALMFQHRMFIYAFTNGARDWECVI